MTALSHVKYTTQKTVKWPLVESIYAASSLDIRSFVLDNTHLTNLLFKGVSAFTDNTVTPIGRQLDKEVK